MFDSCKALVIFIALHCSISCHKFSPEEKSCVPPYDQCEDYGAIFGDYSTRQTYRLCPYGKHLCYNYTNTRNRRRLIRQLNPSCGTHHPYGVGHDRISPGDSLKFGTASMGEFPWMVAIFTVNNDGTEQLLCGGSLIHEKIVMTAAHNVINASEGSVLNLKIRAGEWNTTEKDQDYSHQEQLVKQIIIHPNFKRKINFNDVALLVLEEAVVLEDNEHIDIICLAPKNFVPSSNSRCFSMGWGKNKYGAKGKYRDVLKKIQLPIVDDKQCESYLKKTSLSLRFYLHPSFICAGGESNVDTCTGDGGGPLVCPIPGAPFKFYQVGIVSWGLKCGTQNIPAVYAKVSHLRDWIDAEMGKLNLGISSYTT